MLIFNHRYPLYACKITCDFIILAKRRKFRSVCRARAETELNSTKENSSMILELQTRDRVDDRALFSAGEENLSRIGFHRASFRRNRHDYRQRQRAGSTYCLALTSILAIEIPHDYSRLPPMNVASARSLHILLKATKEFLLIPATQFPRWTGKRRCLVKFLPSIRTPNEICKRSCAKKIANLSCLGHFKNVLEDKVSAICCSKP